jgi:hypothetical protein
MKLLFFETAVKWEKRHLLCSKRLSVFDIMMSVPAIKARIPLCHKTSIKMKKVILMSIVILSSIVSNAQTDSSKIEQYCQVIATPRLLSNKVTIDIDFGEEKSFWRDTRLKTEAGKIRKFNTIIDAMNYMGKEGWIFINAFPVRMGETEIFHFAFKRQFSKSEF